MSKVTTTVSPLRKRQKAASMSYEVAIGPEYKDVGISQKSTGAS